MPIRNFSHHKKRNPKWNKVKMELHGSALRNALIDEDLRNVAGSERGDRVLAVPCCEGLWVSRS